jgi:AcrR family transcriptional regulator
MKKSTNPSKEKWLESGYAHFAEYGPEKLSINQISKELSTSRASFYHHFGEIELFIHELLTKHWQVCEQFNLVGKAKCKKLFPDLYKLLAKYPVELRFNLQVFRHRQIADFNFIFLKSYEATASDFALKLFADHFQLNARESDLHSLWLTVGEAWYSRLDPNDLSEKTLRKHAEVILSTVSRFLNTDLYANLK